ncbi:hypothetical protein ACXYRR_01085 [Mycoplasma sp. 246B]
MSKNIITLDDLTYNKTNFRDLKPKNMSRNDYAQVINKKINETTYRKYLIDKAKKAIKMLNQKYNNNKSEIIGLTDNNDATQVHHIFPQSKFPQIADYLENLIALTPNQHFLMAHPNNSTHYIDVNFQYLALVAKTFTIKSDIESGNENYSFSKFINVLRCGLNT